jgi:CysZ protein
MPTHAITGARYLLRGFGLINQPGIRLFAAVPLLITLLVFAVLIGLGVGYFSSLMDSLLPSGDAWWVTLLRAVLWPLFALAMMLLWYFTFTLVANLIGAPFNGLLAEKVEAHLRGRPLSDTGGLTDAIKDLLPSMLNELRKFAYYLLWAVPLLILFAIPAVNLAAPLLWGLFMAWMLALEYTAYPMENHRIRFRDARRALVAKRGLSLGFGAAVMGLMLVPVLNLLVMPAAVAGATALWVERLESEGGRMKGEG